IVAQTANIQNSGVISSTSSAGIEVVNGAIGNSTANVFNTGTISGNIGIQAHSRIGVNAATADVDNLGTINGLTAAIFGDLINLTNATTGRIEATGLEGVAIDAQIANIRSNAGTIKSTGANGIAVRASTTATIRNSGTIQSTGADSAAIFGNG